jgi:hypothetical protein
MATVDLTRVLFYESVVDEGVDLAAGKAPGRVTTRSNVAKSLRRQNKLAQTPLTNARATRADTLIRQIIRSGRNS